MPPKKHKYKVSASAELKKTTDMPKPKVIDPNLYSSEQIDSIVEDELIRRIAILNKNLSTQNTSRVGDAMQRVRNSTLVIEDVTDTESPTYSEPTKGDAENLAHVAESINKNTTRGVKNATNDTEGVIQTRNSTLVIEDVTDTESPAYSEPTKGDVGSFTNDVEGIVHEAENAVDGADGTVCVFKGALHGNESPTCTENVVYGNKDIVCDVENAVVDTENVDDDGIYQQTFNCLLGRVQDLFKEEYSEIMQHSNVNKIRFFEEIDKVLNKIFDIQNQDGDAKHFQSILAEALFVLFFIESNGIYRMLFLRNKKNIKTKIREIVKELTKGRDISFCATIIEKCFKGMVATFDMMPPEDVRPLYEDSLKKIQILRRDFGQRKDSQQKENCSAEKLMLLSVLRNIEVWIESRDLEKRESKKPISQKVTTDTQNSKTTPSSQNKSVDFFVLFTDLKKFIDVYRQSISEKINDLCFSEFNKNISLEGLEKYAEKLRRTVFLDNLNTSSSLIVLHRQFFSFFQKKIEEMKQKMKDNKKKDNVETANIKKQLKEKLLAFWDNDPSLQEAFFSKKESFDDFIDVMFVAFPHRNFGKNPISVFYSVLLYQNKIFNWIRQETKNPSDLKRYFDSVAYMFFIYCVLFVDGNMQNKEEFINEIIAGAHNDDPKKNLKTLYILMNINNFVSKALTNSIDTGSINALCTIYDDIRNASGNGKKTQDREVGIEKPDLPKASLDSPSNERLMREGALLKQEKDHDLLTEASLTTKYTETEGLDLNDLNFKDTQKPLITPERNIALAEVEENLPYQNLKAEQELPLGLVETEQQLEETGVGSKTKRKRKKNKKPKNELCSNAQQSEELQGTQESNTSMPEHLLVEEVVDQVETKKEALNLNPEHTVEMPENKTDMTEGSKLRPEVEFIIDAVDVVDRNCNLDIDRHLLNKNIFDFIALALTETKDMAKDPKVCTEIIGMVKSARFRKQSPDDPREENLFLTIMQKIAYKKIATLNEPEAPSVSATTEENKEKIEQLRKTRLIDLQNEKCSVFKKFFEERFNIKIHFSKNTTTPALLPPKELKDTMLFPLIRGLWIAFSKYLRAEQIPDIKSNIEGVFNHKKNMSCWLGNYFYILFDQLDIVGRSGYEAKLLDLLKEYRFVGELNGDYEEERKFLNIFICLGNHKLVLCLLEQLGIEKFYEIIKGKEEQFISQAFLVGSPEIVGLLFDVIKDRLTPKQIKDIKTQINFLYDGLRTEHGSGIKYSPTTYKRVIKNIAEATKKESVTAIMPENCLVEVEYTNMPDEELVLLAHDRMIGLQYEINRIILKKGDASVVSEATETVLSVLKDRLANLKNTVQFNIEKNGKIKKDGKINIANVLSQDDRLGFLQNEIGGIANKINIVSSNNKTKDLKDAPTSIVELLTKKDRDTVASSNNLSADTKESKSKRKRTRKKKKNPVILEVTSDVGNAADSCLLEPVSDVPSTKTRESSSIAHVGNSFDLSAKLPDVVDDLPNSVVSKPSVPPRYPIGVTLV